MGTYFPHGAQMQSVEHVLSYLCPFVFLARQHIVSGLPGLRCLDPCSAAHKTHASARDEDRRESPTHIHTQHIPGMTTYFFALYVSGNSRL